jgi:hypothetical protein
MKKVTDTIRKLLLALILALALLNVTSCDMPGGDSPTLPGSPTNPTNPNNPTTPNTPTSYHDFANFNPADYPILNESGKPDSAIADLKDWIWLMYAEREDVGEWTANYVKTNKIKTILKYGRAYYVDTSQLDGFYVSADILSDTLEFSNEYYADDDRAKADIRESMFNFFTHETMHIVQWKSSGWIDLMKGMRPDICAAARMLTEFLAWFYTTHRYDSAYVYADMPNAVEIQSKYMIIETELLVYDNDTGPARGQHYDDMRAKDPSLPPFIIGSSWFFSTYAEAAFVTGEVRRSAMTPPLHEASKEDMLKIARALLACRDPKMAGVTDEALWTVFDALREAAGGNSKYFSYGGLDRDLLNTFQEFIAEWDAAYAAQ